MRLSDEVFKTVIESAPLVSVDFVIKNALGACLLGLRTNSPAKGFWFNLGGRIRKNETIKEAQRRVFLDETGMELQAHAPIFLGAYDHIYSTNVFETPNFGTHYVCLTYEVFVPDDFFPLTTLQHSDYEWKDISKALKDIRVHDNTKIALQASVCARAEFAKQ